MADAPVPYLYQPGESELRWMGRTSTHFLATGDQTGGVFSLVDEQATRGESVPLHRHRDDMESFDVEDVPPVVEFRRRSRCDCQAVRTIAASLVGVRAASA